MRSRWSEADAAAFVARYASRWGEDLSLRTYTSRLLGGDDRLVLHGGGNTSVKSSFTNRLGETIPALYVKASGHDLATLEPDGLPGVDLGYLRKLRALPALDDEAMTNELPTHLFGARRATPSRDTLRHAVLPDKFGDPTHAHPLLPLTHRGARRLPGDDRARHARRDVPGAQGSPPDRVDVGRDSARAPPPRGARAARRPRGTDGRRGSAAPPRRRGAARHARGARIRRPRGE